jgi:hypothetical protein
MRMDMAKHFPLGEKPKLQYRKLLNAATPAQLLTPLA